jgi:uncharacterized membrane protein
MKVNFWFAPAVMSLGAALLAWAMYRVDLIIPNDVLETSRFFLAGTPDQIRSNLLSMAGTILTTAGVVFTLLTLPLSTVAAQYGSRLLRIFLADRTTQVILGMFVATFVYCITLALSIPPETVEPDAPQVSATVGLLLMLGTFASLIILIQHIGTMLQAPNIAAAAGAQLREVVLAELTLEDEIVEQTGQQIVDVLVEKDGYPIRVRESGYIQYVDPQSVLTLAGENDLVIRLLCKPGHFVGSGTVVARVWPANRMNEELDRELQSAIRRGNGRTPTQDLVYAVNQISEMAVRAMSAAINDPFTAITCLDHLGEGLGLFIQQDRKSPHYYDQDHRLRLVLEPATFDELLGAAFDMLRHASCNDASVLLHMLKAIEDVTSKTKSPEARQSLFRHVNLIQCESQAGNLIEQDRRSIQCAAEAIQLQLKEAV